MPKPSKAIRSSIFSPFPPFGKDARATATASETSKAELSQKVSEANERVAALQIQVTTSEAQRWAPGLITSDHSQRMQVDMAFGCFWILTCF